LAVLGDYSGWRNPSERLCDTLIQRYCGGKINKVNILVYQLEKLDSGIESYNLTPIPFGSILTILPVTLVGALA